MFRPWIAAWSLALLVFPVGSVEAGLLSALETSLTGLEPAETISIPVGTESNATPYKESNVIYMTQLPNRSLSILPSFGIPFNLEDWREIELATQQGAIDRRKQELAGSLFIDPLTSTLGQGVFGEGPQLQYDRTTGGLSVFAPPMLGPADEFGIRRQYSPVSITIDSGGRFAATISLQEIGWLVKNDSLLRGAINGEPPPEPLTPQSPSFKLGEDSNIGYSVSGERLTFPTAINLWNLSLHYPSSDQAIFGDFDQLLEPWLDPQLFKIDARLVTDEGFAVVSPYITYQFSDDPAFQLSPKINARVKYSRTNRPRGVIHFLDEFSLFASPVIVPEPGGTALVLLVAIAGSLPSFLSPRVTQRHRPVQRRLARF